MNFELLFFLGFNGTNEENGTMEEDREFFCVSTLRGHTQDVKNVIFHPTKQVLLVFFLSFFPASCFLQF